MIKEGSSVSFHYVLTIDEKVVDSSEGEDPFTYTHGSGQIVPGLEQELTGKTEGDKLNVLVEPEMAYGNHRPEAVHRLNKEAFQDAEGIQVGDFVRGQIGEEQFAAVVSEITAGHVTLDMNHPLAGKTLHFDIEVVAVR